MRDDGDGGEIGGVINSVDNVLSGVSCGGVGVTIVMDVQVVTFVG